MKSAVCLLIPQVGVAGTYLAVSRRNDTTRWGLPGGKQDPGETNLQAALRELLEETGIVLDPEQVEPLFSAACPGKGPDDTYWVTTYVWKGPAVQDAQFKPEAGLEIRWVCERVLQDPRRCPFAGYNKGVFEALKAYSA